MNAAMIKLKALKNRRREKTSRIRDAAVFSFCHGGDLRLCAKLLVNLYNIFSSTSRSKGTSSMKSEGRKMT